jgi:hypothetical protein
MILLRSKSQWEIECHYIPQRSISDDISAFCRGLVSPALRSVHSRVGLPKSLLSLAATIEFGMLAAKNPSGIPMNPRLRVAQNSDRGLMRSREFEWHGCVAPIPKEAYTGFEEARGESFAYPTGRCEMSRGCRTSNSRRGREEPEQYNRPETLVSVTGSTRFSKTSRLSGAGGPGKPSPGVRRICRSLVSVFLWSVVASRARRQLRLGIDSISAIARQRRTGNCGVLAGENRTRASFGS